MRPGGQKHGRQRVRSEGEHGGVRRGRGHSCRRRDQIGVSLFCPACHVDVCVAITRTASKHASRALRRYYNSRRVYAVTVSPPPRARISCLLGAPWRPRAGWVEARFSCSRRTRGWGGPPRAARCLSRWKTEELGQSTEVRAHDAYVPRWPGGPPGDARRGNLARATRSGENPRAD